MEVGGAEVLVATLCRLQRLGGHEVSVHCITAEGALGRDLSADGFPVFLHGPGAPWRTGLRLWRRLRERPVDVVHCHNVGATLIAAPAARLAGVRTIVTTRHGMAPPGTDAAREFKFWLAARLCRRVVAVCRTTHENMRQAPGARPEMIATIYNCASAAARSKRREPASNKDGFTLINVARHAPEKDLPTLLRAVAIARTKRPDVHLWLLGTGTVTRDLMDQAAALGLERHVTFLGERADVGDWLSRADLFVMSSVSEGLPLSLLEAMAAGVPQLLTSVGGMAEVAGISGAGVLVPPRDAQALGDAIVELAADPGRLAELGARARACYEQRFAPERMNAEYLELYRECGAPREVTAVTLSSR